MYTQNGVVWGYYLIWTTFILPRDWQDRRILGLEDISSLFTGKETEAHVEEFVQDELIGPRDTARTDRVRMKNFIFYTLGF